MATAPTPLVDIPEFLTTYAPTRWRRRFTPFSRVPATGRFGEVWHVAAERDPEQRVFVDRPPAIDPGGPTRRDYAGWAAMVDEMAAALHQAGVRPWDRVAIMKSNHLDVALLGSAAARLGAIPALLAWNHPPEIAHKLLERLQRPYLVTDIEHLGSCGLDEDAIAALTARCISVDGNTGRPDIVAWDDLRGATPPAPLLRPDDEPMVITHTSGTTGVPKLVMHSADSAYSLALVETERWPLFRLRGDDTVAFCDPFCHQRITTGLLAMATVTPTMMMLSEPFGPGTRRLLGEQPPTVVETLPNIYLAWEGLARDVAQPFRNVRLYINSFDAIHTRTIRTFLDASHKRLPIWVQSWSQSENGALVIRPYTRRSVRHRGRRPPPTQVLGWPIPTVGKVRAVDPDSGRQVRHGEVGLIEISQPGRCLAYVDEQDRHELKCDGEWWNTGDLGVINRFGAVRLIDREIDRIPGASAIELEDVLLDRLPETTEVVVLPVSDGLPVPVLSTDHNLPIDRDRWGRATADLPRLADPVHLNWDEFPRTATWKIRRVALRERLFSGSQAHGIGRWT